MWRCRQAPKGLSPNQQVDVFRFLHRYKREAAGRLMITVPTGVRDKAAIAQSVQEIQRLVAEAGVDYRLRHGAQRDAPAGSHPRDPARLSASGGGAAAV